MVEAVELSTRGRPRKNVSEARVLDAAAELARTLNREAAARYRERNRETIRNNRRRWLEGNREKSREMSREWRNRKLKEGTPEEVAAIRAAENEKTKRQYAECKRQVYDAYGGSICACCGESQEMFLSVDHVNNDGAQERRSGEYGKSGGGTFYTWLRKKGFPPGYQILCMNCQVGKHKNGGVCPHQQPARSSKFA